MDAFSYLAVLLSIVLGLGLTQLLTAAGRIIRQRESIKLHWLPLLWTAPRCCTSRSCSRGFGDRWAVAPPTGYGAFTVEKNVAVTTLPAVKRGVNVHVSANPVHTAPVQPSKELPLAGVAVSVTAPTNAALHTLPQLIPAGLDVTVPVPVPTFETTTRGRAAMVSDSCATAVSPSALTPLTYIPRVRAADVSVVAKVRVLDTLFPLSDGGSNVGVTSVGRGPVKSSVTIPLELPVRVRATVTVPFADWTTVSAFGRSIRLILLPPFPVTPPAPHVVSDVASSNVAIERLAREMERAMESPAGRAPTLADSNQLARTFAFLDG